VIFLARVLSRALAAAPGMGVADLRGGDKRNAIPREAEAHVLVPRGQAAAFDAAVARAASDISAEYKDKEPEMKITCSSEGTPATSSGLHVIEEKDLRAILDLLRTLPHGPLKFSHVIPGLVETSNNVASIKPHADSPASAYSVTCSTRSSIMPALEAHRDRLEVIARALGCSAFDREEAYPGWAPSSSSEILKVTERKYEEVFGKKPHVSAIHAGLECGILGEKIPGVDCVSFGPTITGAHSPDERCLVPTVRTFFTLLVSILEEVADRKA
jgi:dipeptidase D